MSEPSESGEDFGQRLRRAEKRLARERQARLEAERIAERGLRELYEKKEHLRLLERVAARANLSDSVEDVFRFALGAIRLHCGASLATVFWRKDDGLELHPAPIWDADDFERLGDFLEAGAALTFSSGAGLPGRVMQSRAAIWLDDVVAEPGFLRAAEARSAGLHAAVAFPIVVGSEVVAVAELFHPTVKEPDDALIAALTQVGIQLGRVFERSRADERLRHEAAHDALTGLPNRRSLLARMEEGFQPKRRFKLLLLDLDRFKAVNDAFGHPTGDLLLVKVAERLQAVAGLGVFVARLGGDELAMLVEGDLDHALEVGERVIAAFGAPFDLGRASVTIGCSIGVCCTDDAGSVMELMQLTDMALYEAKRGGRGRTACYSHGLREDAAARHHLEDDMRAALGRGEFHIAYQPLLALRDDRIIGYEALIRWDHPLHGPVSPERFIPLAERSEIIVAIGRWVLEEACREAAGWAADQHVAVNVSPVQLRSPQFAEHIASALALSGLPAARLAIEVTETALIDSGERAGEILGKLRAFGVKVALDDFGTGFSSLAHLRRLPFDRIKIDRSFVTAASADRAAMAVLKGVIGIGRDLGVATLAEGVETEEQRALLRALGCDEIQGYLIGRPARMRAIAAAAA